MKINKKSLLKQIKSLIITELNLNIEKVILFGSQISGKAQKYSDYDILIILNQNYSWIDEEKIIEITFDLSLKYEILLDIKFISINELNSLRGKQPFIQSAIKNGISA
jgi:uncharacterized protein